MPIFRKPSGEVVEDPTEIVKKPTGGTSPVNQGRGNSNVDEKTVPVKRRRGNFFPDEDPTVPINRIEKPAEPDDKDSEDTVFASGLRKRKIGSEASPLNQEGSNVLEHAVVGWLVIIEGPGKGTALSVGYGENTIGRSPDSLIKLDFGDDGISRSKQASLTYDALNREFFFIKGGGRNLWYIDGKSVRGDVDLTTGQEISISKTKMRFIAFCGESFDWQDLDD